MNKFYYQMLRSFAVAGVLFVLTASMISNVSASESQSGEGYSIINTSQAHNLYQQGAQFVDTRSWFEIKFFGVVSGALTMRDKDVFQTAEYLLPDKEKEVVLYCAVGVRASDAANKLAKLGYKKVYVLGDGEGFSDWKKAGLPITKSN